MIPDLIRMGCDAGPETAREATTPRTPRARLLVLTVGFTVGGAEQLILMTAPRLRREGFDVTVACLKGWGPLGDELEARGVRAVALGATGAVLLGTLLDELEARDQKRGLVTLCVGLGMAVATIIERV